MNRAVEAADELRKETGSAPSVYNMRYLKPLDEKLIEEALVSADTFLTLEDGSLCGGLFGAVTEYMASKGHMVRIERLGIPDRFIAQDTQKAQRKECGLDKDSILEKVRALMQKD